MTDLQRSYAGAAPACISGGYHLTEALRARRLIAAKTRALLMQRQVIPAAFSELAPDAFGEWLRQAMEIQRAIYDIDRYYEESTKIELAAEAPMWAAVERRITLVKPHSSAIFAAFSDLRHYADAERRLHVLDPISPAEFANILFLKCADVRIARNLIWCFGARGPTREEGVFWNLYDQCWELIEDLQDLHEDGKDWNFNFWLYSFMAGGAAATGVESVTGLFRRRLVDLQDSYGRLATELRSRYGRLLAATLSAGRQLEHLRGIVFEMIASGQVTPFAERFSGSPSGSKAGLHPRASRGEVFHERPRIVLAC